MFSKATGFLLKELSCLRSELFYSVRFPLSLALQGPKIIVFFSAKRSIRRLKCSGDQVSSHYYHAANHRPSTFYHVVEEVIMFAFFLQTQEAVFHHISNIRITTIIIISPKYGIHLLTPLVQQHKILKTYAQTLQKPVTFQN